MDADTNHGWLTLPEHFRRETMRTRRGPFGPVSTPMLEPLAAALLFSFAAGAAAAEIRSSPGHPLADAMGYVIACCSDEAEPVIEGGFALESPYPYQAGWPVDLSAQSPYEGALLVQADDDQELEVLFVADFDIHLYNHDGTELDGWPVTVPTGSAISGQPAFGDLDGDGEGEVVVTSDNWPNGSLGWTYAYHADGALAEGFPLLTNGDHSRSPTVVDLDGDGACEIIVGERDYPIGRVYVCDGTGQLLAGWPQEIDHVPASSAGAADIDDDGTKEIVYESYASVYAFEMDGSLLEGFPYTPSTGDVFSYSAPVFADIDEDGYLEIAVGGHNTGGSNHMFLLNHDGTDCAGWPNSVGYWIYAPATFADMDADGDRELMVGDQVLSGTPTNHMYAWHHDGTSVAGWPVGPVDAINAQAAVADIDGDQDPEFIWDTNITPGKLMGCHHTGDAIDGWPINTEGSTFFNTAALGDVDLDQDLELLVLTQLEDPLCTVHLWDIPDAVDSSCVRMPMFQYGPGRHGEYIPAPSQGVEGTSGGMLPRAALRAFPNPFRTSVTMIPPHGAHAGGDLRVYDLGGRLVAEIAPLADGSGTAYVWDGLSATGRELPAGVYTARVRRAEGDLFTLLLKL